MKDYLLGAWRNQASGNVIYTTGAGLSHCFSYLKAHAVHQIKRPEKTVKKTVKFSPAHFD